MRDFEHLRELIPAYVIGATDEDESRMVEAGLTDYPELAEELREFQFLNDALAESVPEMAPPPEMLGQLLTAARGSRPAAHSAPKILPRPAQRQVKISWQLVAACLTLFLVLTNGFWLYRASVPTVKEIVFQGNPEAELIGLRCRIIVSPNSDSAIMIAENFPLLEVGQTYQVWMRRDGEIVSLGMFIVDEAGDGLLSFTADAINQPFDSIGVTIEPLGGSPAPTTPSVVRWTSI